MSENQSQPFNLQSLVEELKIASQGVAPLKDVQLIMDRAFNDPASIRDQMPAFEEDEINLYEDDAISIWHCRFLPGTPVPPHDHQMSAIIGVYAGTERNCFYTTETEETVTLSGHTDMEPGDILKFTPTSIHSVECISDEPSCGIHVYFGPLSKIDRSLFDERNQARLTFTEEAFKRLTETP